jgi:glycosyltransferase involved in cell wall biosynthesis
VAAPLVSVVVLTNNREVLLRETVQSILSQDLGDLELIVVDNESADGTARYMAGLADRRVRYFRNPNHGIVSVNRNFGIRQARGALVAFCDDDDLWLPQKLSRQVQAMRAAPAAVLCFTNGVAFRKGEDHELALVSGKKRLLRRAFAGLLLENTIPSCSVMARREALERVGMFDESAELVAVEDWELWLRLAHLAPPLLVDEPLVRVRIHESLSARPSVTVLRNMVVVRTIARKLPVHPLLIGASLAYQNVKRAWFLLQGR